MLKNLFKKQAVRASLGVVLGGGCVLVGGWAGRGGVFEADEDAEVDLGGTDAIFRL